MNKGNNIATKILACYIDVDSTPGLRRSRNTAPDPSTCVFGVGTIPGFWEEKKHRPLTYPSASLVSRRTPDLERGRNIAPNIPVCVVGIRTSLESCEETKHRS